MSHYFILNSFCEKPPSPISGENGQQKQDHHKSWICKKWLVLFSNPAGFLEWVLYWVLEERQPWIYSALNTVKIQAMGKAQLIISEFWILLCRLALDSLSSWPLRKVECARGTSAFLGGKGSNFWLGKNPWNLQIATSYSCAYQPQYQNEFVIKLKPQRTTRFQNMSSS